jgi:hypothetical protein
MSKNHDRPARLRFSDGMKFDLSGDLRVVRKGPTNGVFQPPSVCAIVPSYA